MAKITYLIGAGASANAIPVVEKISDGLESIIKLLQLSYYRLDDRNGFSDIPNSQTMLAYQTQLREDLIWLQQHASRHLSIDSYAKKLFITKKNDDLRRLKITLSFFLILFQKLNNADKRYDSFFASILKNSHKDLPDNIKIVSWNYDHQFEIAFDEYSLEYDIIINQQLLNLKYRQGPTQITVNNKFSIFKLNGTPCLLDHKNNNVEFTNGYNDKIQMHPADESQVTSGKAELLEIIHHYARVKTTTTANLGLTFAWEKMNDAFMQSVIEEIKDTDILIIIGYSFPYFNREVDAQILKSLDPKKVYIQSKEPHNIINRLEATLGDTFDGIEIKDDLEQFLIPSEL